MGLDGFRRGTSLPGTANGVFKFGNGFDASASVTQKEPGDALAVTMGKAAVASDGSQTAPAVASTRFAPVPGAFSARAILDNGTNATTIEASANQPALADAIVVANRSTDRFAQLTVEQLNGSATAKLTRGQGSASVDYSGPSTRVSFADYVHAGTVLDLATTAIGQSRFTVATSPSALHYAAPQRIPAFDTSIYDRGLGLVAATALRDIPPAVDVLTDVPARHLRFAGNGLLGSGTATISHELGSIPVIENEHLALIVAGTAWGASARETGLRSVNAYFGVHPLTNGVFEPGGQEFTTAADINGSKLSRVDISNVAASLQMDLNTEAREIAYTASGAVHRVQAAVDIDSGADLFVAVDEAPAAFGITYELSEKPKFHYTAAGVAPRLQLFAGSPQTHLSAVATAVPTDLTFGADFPARHLAGTVSRPLGNLNAVTSVPLGGRIFGLAFEASGVPGGFDADFADGLLRLRSLAGPIGATSFAVTNNTADMQRPVGRHLAARFRQLTGDFDASASVYGLSTVEYSRTVAGQTFRLDVDSGGEPVVADADIVTAASGLDDIRLAATARVTSVPATLQVNVSGGVLTFQTDHRTGIAAEARIGKVAALSGLGAPLFGQGLAAHVAGCTSGPGCTTDTSALCTTFDRCFGVVGTLSLPLLRTVASAELANRKVTVNAESLSGPLKTYLQLDGGLIGAVDRLRCLATLTGLPSGAFGVTLSKFGFDPSLPAKLEVASTSAGGYGGIQVDADADTTTTFGDVRGRMTAAAMPSVLTTEGQFGSVSHISVNSTSPMDALTVQTTGLLSGNPASGRADLTNVPSRMDLIVTGNALEGLAVPDLTYDGHMFSTLDGSVQVEADLVEALSTGGITVPVAGDVELRFTDLGSDTAISTLPDRSVRILSSPGTGALSIGAALETSIPNVPVDIQVFDQNGFTGRLVGHAGAPVVHIGDLGLSMTSLRSMLLRPGLPGYLTIGIEGIYGILSVDAGDTFVDPDFDLTLEVDGPAFLDYDITVAVNDPMTGVRFHLSDQVLRQSGCVATEVLGVGVGHLRIFTKPGKTSVAEGHIDVFGADGPQALNYLDPVPPPNGLDPSLVSIFLDLMTVYVTDPLSDSEAEYEPDFGGC